MIRRDERPSPIRMPLTPARMRALATALRETGAPALRTLPLEARIAAIERVAASWLADDSSWRRRALDEVAAATGLPAAAVAVAVDNLWSALRAKDLMAVWRAEGVHAAATGDPALAVHVLAGNVPGVGIFAIVAALVAGIPSLVKPAAREPVLPRLFAESIADVAPELHPGLAVAPWRGGTADLDAAALDAADVVLAYGRDTTLDELATRRPKRFLRYGNRASVCVVAASAQTRATARALAWQTALYDQQGCLSPQIVCVEETARGEVDAVADAVARELDALEHELPRAVPILAETASIWRYLERARWRAQEGEPVRIHGGVAGAASIVCDRTAAWPTSPTFRHLVMLPVARLADARAALQRLAGTIEAVGYAGPTERLDEAAAIAAHVGAVRLCPLDRMQAPPFAWRQSGHARIASLLGRDAPATEPPPFA